MTTYQCDDGNAHVEIDADSPGEAAREYVDGGDWGVDGVVEKTIWVRVHVWTKRKDHGWITVQLDPEEPECSDDRGHDWRTPYEIVGGIKENPGVWGHGGGCMGVEVCVRCGCGRHWDSWAQNPETGEQGLSSVRYEAGEFRDDLSAITE